VSFAYAGRNTPAVSDISLEIPAGTMAAFVGPTGSGKTTLVDLLLGLYEPTEGHIEIDALKLEPGTLPAWRSRVGYVPQFIFLGDISIARNIAFGVPEDMIDRTAVERAARVAQLDSFVATLPAGYDTVVGERGVRLSGGQRQRIGIARALYHDPEVLILDEATSALDTVTEEAVMREIHQMRDRRTIVMIAHRLSTVRECPLIVVLARGKIVAQGDYDTLAASSRIFRAMAKVK
jgi:ABC-type multidrug transport system fused ATPase/permease subunit